jgi:hypothetical protein
MPKIVIFIRGGIVHTVWSDTDGVELRVVDQDTERMDDSDLVTIDGSPAFLTEEPVWKKGREVRAVFDKETSA